MLGPLYWALLVAQMVKNLPSMWETWVWSWAGKILWRRAGQSTSVFSPGESTWTEEPGGLQSMGSQRVRPHWATKHTGLFSEAELGTASVIHWLIYSVNVVKYLLLCQGMCLALKVSDDRCILSSFKGLLSRGSSSRREDRHICNKHKSTKIIAWI